MPGANQSEESNGKLPRGCSLQRGGPTNAAMGGVGAGLLCSQCLTFFSNGGKGERTWREARSPQPLSVCLWWFLFPGRRGKIISHSPPFPGLLLYLEDLSGFWFGWGPMRMWDPSIKDSIQRACGWWLFGFGF